MEQSRDKTDESECLFETKKTNLGAKNFGKLSLPILTLFKYFLK